MISCDGEIVSRERIFREKGRCLYIIFLLCVQLGFVY